MTLREPREGASGEFSHGSRAPSARLSRGPAVFLHVSVDASAALREVRAGLEEEGVPCRVTRSTGDAVALAYAAATTSPVSVGVGLDGDVACLHLPQLPPDRPLLRLAAPHDPERLRALGHNAARLVKGAPLKELP